MQNEIETNCILTNYLGYDRAILCSEKNTEKKLMKITLFNEGLKRLIALALENLKIENFWKTTITEMLLTVPVLLVTISLNKKSLATNQSN